MLLCQMYKGRELWFECCSEIMYCNIVRPTCNSIAQDQSGAILKHLQFVPKH